MVTLPIPARLKFVKRSLAAYCNQIYGNRELVIVLDVGLVETRAEVIRFVNEMGRNDIRVIDPSGPLTLGALRNISWREARGEFVCQWDDDDLYHPLRLERQLAALQESGSLSGCLQEVMQFFPASRRLFQTNWRATPPTAMPASLMCLKATPICYPETGTEARIGEDLVVLTQLQRLGRFHALSGAPHLYVYVSHGHNTYANSHHQMIAEELAVSQGLLRRRETALRQELADFDFGPGDVLVEGRNGPAFKIVRRQNEA
jgi:glycosyltransferase involved in cell wall biosynthesis